MMAQSEVAFGGRGSTEYQIAHLNGSGAADEYMEPIDLDVYGLATPPNFWFQINSGAITGVVVPECQSSISTLQQPVASTLSGTLLHGSLFQNVYYKTTAYAAPNGYYFRHVNVSNTRYY